MDVFEYLLRGFIAEGNRIAVDVDLAKFFDRVNHDILMHRLKRHINDKALADFKHQIRRLTKRSWGISMQRRFYELRLYIQRWINYFGLSEYYRPLPGLDQWIRRRIRMCY